MNFKETFEYVDNSFDKVIDSIKKECPEIRNIYYFKEDFGPPSIKIRLSMKDNYMVDSYIRYDQLLFTDVDIYVIIRTRIIDMLKEYELKSGVQVSILRKTVPISKKGVFE